jgi:hypothetical protein
MLLAPRVNRRRLISRADLGAGTDTARALSASITRAGIW